MSPMHVSIAALLFMPLHLYRGDWLWACLLGLLSVLAFLVWLFPSNSERIK